MKLDTYGVGIAKGMALTLKHLFRHPITTQYPEQRLSPSRRIRGNDLIWNKEKCTGCGTCAKSCPIGAITIVTSPELVENIYEVAKYEVDCGYCIQCGLCVEACPYQALYLDSSYEKAKYQRHDLVHSKEELRYTSERKPSGYFYPEFAEKLPEQTLLVERKESIG